MRYRPAQIRRVSDEDDEQQTARLGGYVLYGTCGALAPIILDLVLRIFGLAGSSN